MVKVVRYGLNRTQIVVPERDLIIGRDFLKIDDKRVSRQHCKIRVEKAAENISLYIQSLHQTNPTFYCKKESTCPLVLGKDENILLGTGDKFRLTPDGDWFVVEDIEIRTQTENREEDTQEITDLVGLPDSATILSHESNSTNDEGMKRSYECDDAAEPGACKRSRVDAEDKVPSTSSVISNPASSSHEADEDAASIKIKPDPDSHASSSTSVSAVTIKPDPHSATMASTSGTPTKIKPDPDTATIASTSGIPTKIKPDPDGLVAPNGNSSADSGAIRPSCDFGIRCYRGGKDHRTSLAHPGDPDYRRPNFPAAPNGSPLCPFGARCYRRNPSHFQEYQHPDSSVLMLDRTRRRRAGPVDPNALYDYRDNDEDDNADFDGSSSDEFYPDPYDDDGDNSVSSDEGLGCVDSGYQD